MEIIKSEFLGFNSENESLQRIIGFCNSSESKPTENIKNGSKLTELDTGDVYFFDEDIGWQKVVVGEGGGSSDLPEVTADDNGKVLTVVNGDWGVADAGGDTVYQILNTFSGNITWGEWSHGECTGVFVTNHQPSEDEWSAIEMTITINGVSNDVYIGQSPVSLDNLPSGMTAQCSKTPSDNYVAISILVSSVSEVTLSGSVDGDFYALTDKLGALLGY